MDDERKRQLIWLGGILAALAALLVMGWLLLPVYRQHREKTELRLAQGFFDKGDYRNASLSVRQVLISDPTNVAACRIMATLADLAHSPAALDWQRRITQAEPTVENKLLLAAAGLRYQGQPFPLTAQILEELAPAATNLPSYQVLAASLALGLHRPAEAEAHFDAAARLEPTNRLYEMNLAVVRLNMTNEAKAVASRAVLESLRSDANLGPPALRSLVVDRLAHQDAEGANAYSTQLLASAKATLADRLQYLGILRRLKRDDFAARLQAVQQTAATNAASAAQVAAWMLANDLLADDIRWLTNLPAALQSQAPVRLALADGYLQSSNWQALRDFACKGNWDETEFVRLALAARAWSQLGAPEVADGNWTAAINEAGSRFGALNTLLGLVEQWKLPRQREDLLERMVEKFPRERWPQQALEQLYVAKGDTAALNRLCAQVFPLFPQDAGLKNNLAFTSLLLKTNLPKAFVWAREIYSANTNNPSFASTYAFALYLQGRTAEGLAVLDGLNPPLLEQPSTEAPQGRTAEGLAMPDGLNRPLLEQPSTALYYGLLLSALGRTGEARHFLEIAQADTNLLPEEIKLIAESRMAK